MLIVEKNFDVQTGEETIIEREETPQEKAEREQFEVRIAEQNKLASEQAAKRAEILAKLGITEDEAKLLLS